MVGQLRLGFRHALLCWGHAKELRPATSIHDEAAKRRFVRQCLKNRDNAPKRIGIGYKVIRTDGMCGYLSNQSADNPHTQERANSRQNQT